MVAPEVVIMTISDATSDEKSRLNETIWHQAASINLFEGLSVDSLYEHML